MFGIPFEISKGPAGGQWEMSKGPAGGQWEESKGPAGGKWECTPREEFKSIYESNRRSKSATSGSLEETLGALFPPKKHKKRKHKKRKY